MQHTFTIDKRTIRVSVTHNGRQYRKATGLVVADPVLWDAKAKSLRAKCKDRRVIADLLGIHARLTEKESTARSEADVLAAIDYALAGARRYTPIAPPSGAPTFWEYFDEWGSRPSSSQRQRTLAVRVVARLMGRRENWDQIDSAYWFRLMQKMEEAGYSVNYRWNVGTRLKTAMHEGYRLKYHTNQEFREFKVRKEETDAIALTSAEIELFWNYEPATELLGKVRDLALIGYYSAARFSDYSRLTLENIRNGRLEFVQKKTRDRVMIPASPRLVTLLERNGGRSPKVCQQVFNRQLKDLARDAGVEGYIEIHGVPEPRWKHCSSHTFRRSAITNLYLSGVPIKDCMFVSGHKDIRAFQSYLRISREEAVGRLADYEFFQHH